MLRPGVGRKIAKGAGKGALYTGAGIVGVAAAGTLAYKAAFGTVNGISNATLALTGSPERDLLDGALRYSVNPGNYNRVKLPRDIERERQEAIDAGRDPEEPGLFKPTQYVHGGRVENNAPTAGNPFGTGYGRRNYSYQRQNFNPSGDIVLGMYRMR